MDEYLYQYVKYIRLHATINDVDILKWVGPFDILIKFKDGEMYIFDTYTNMYRYIKYKTKELTESEWKFEFSKRLQEMMLRKHITQEYLSSRLRMSQPMVSKYIKGTSMPSGFIMSKILDILDCDIEDLLFIPNILKTYL